MKLDPNQTARNLVLLAVFLPVFIAIIYLLQTVLDARHYDFAAYWQASRMTLDGQNVYDSSTWLAMRQKYQTALHSEDVFQYPLPLAVLLIPLGKLPVQTAYFIWMFFSLVALLLTFLLLLSFYPQRSVFFEVMLVAGLFLFRPVYSALIGGQILALLLFCLAFSTLLFAREKWFLGGGMLAFLALKPSLGLPFLVLSGTWLLKEKRWRALIGMVLADTGLLLLGMAFNADWVAEYFVGGSGLAAKYYGLQTTLWGLGGMLLKTRWGGLLIGAVLSIFVLTLSGQALLRQGQPIAPFAAMATLVPAALLVAPYSWSYDQILLLLPLIFLLIQIANRFGDWAAAFFLVFVSAFAAGLFFIANALGHDVWSVTISGLVFAGAIYFLRKR
ncbi:MAG: hypothetical protein Fur0035_06980 [Anaerolineales bacterium]